ncbi:MAG TPA: coproporphyrinogen-III oxidase family protein [Planctomycetota bacterium]|nr:coproporphyrinogen-III oxidase family protein [Planctomycetota bacterium]
MTAPLSEEKTEVGSYFISNYPPFSFWKKEALPRAEAALNRPARAETPLGLYLHIPFCRKRCKFCYFRVYTDKNSKDVERYMAALAREVDLYRERAVLSGRPLRFAYFGGGTPSFLSEKQLLSLVERLRASVTWDDAEEVTFECEPGTLTERKLEVIRDIGVTRLSLGAENFNDAILEENGRAHHAPEVFRAYEWARRAGFEQVNIDLIAGMVGETWESWRDTVAKARDLAPDSLTVYQMELPFNAVYAKSLPGGAVEVADWKTKREWVDHAFSEMEKVGYQVSSAYTVVRSPEARFVYRDAVWHGADMVGTGVASFSHVGGVHYQNADTDDAYISMIEEGRLPLARALEPTPRQLLIRELILQLKLGRLEASYFQANFGVGILSEFREAFAEMGREGFCEFSPSGLVLTRAGLLRVDSLLPLFFEPAHRGARYT